MVEDDNLNSYFTSTAIPHRAYGHYITYNAYYQYPTEVYPRTMSSTATNNPWCADSFNKYVDVRNIVNESDINVAWNMSPKIEPDIEKIDAENSQLNEFLDSFKQEG